MLSYEALFLELEILRESCYTFVRVIVSGNREFDHDPVHLLGGLLFVLAVVFSCMIWFAFTCLVSKASLRCFETLSSKFCTYS